AADPEPHGARGRANGVDDLRLLDGEEARALEPALRCTRALLSPSTGIVDSHGLLGAFEADARAAGAALALLSPVTGGAVGGAGLVLNVAGRSPTTLRCRALVNACGLDAQALARRLDGLDARTIPTAHYAKGSTFALRGPSPFARLVYPLAVSGGLGIHLTLDLAGNARFGPDVQWIDADVIDYAFDETRAASFYAAVRRYWPALPDDALAPGTTGIRPKLGPAGAPAQDFLLSGPAAHGVPGLVNLYGIESPGLTAALALADAVVAELA
ncbi:MAG: FAD-dependent oxidoreductase, partial [Myxococcales bacterium]|nr:FAD-dependent oxidoreductase [Myxococcales bacterium]